MKHISILVATLLLSLATAFAQVPQGFSYQAVVRDAQNAVIANQPFDITIVILQGETPDAAKAVYSETHSVKTNANGLFTLTVGGGKTTDNFSAIDWGSGNHYLKTESTYGTFTSQLLSVPFALYAAKAAETDIDLSEYAKKSEIPIVPTIPSIPTKVSELQNDSQYLTQHQDLSAYALKTDIPTIPSIPTKTSDLENDSDFLTSHQDITGKADKSEMTITNGTGTATIQLKTGTSATVLTQHQDISGKLDAATAEATYAKKTDIETELAALRDIIKKQEFKIALLSGDMEVDLGLTSGTLWATCNLGATSPEQYGDYYAWGETEPYYSSQDPLTWKEGKTGYNWASYTKLSEGAYNKLTKYCYNSSYGNNGFTDALTTLEPADDAATANWGCGWAMPTAEDFQELYNECYWLWTTDYNGTGIAGCIVYKSADKTKDKRRTKSSDHTYSIATDEHIFLPAAGFRGNASLNGAGSIGYYWPASLDASSPEYALIPGFSSSYVSPPNGSDRYKGFPIRPVRRP